MTTTQPSMLTSSVISFPERGQDGRSNYRGNTSGKVMEAFLRMFHRDPQGLFVDPCEGGGTSRDVAARLGIRYTGFDLNNGFDLTAHARSRRQPAHASANL